MTALILFVCGQSAWAQKEIWGEESFWERTYFGGNFGLSFGSNNFTVEASPEAGYMFTDRLSAGLGLVFQYYKYKLETRNGSDIEFSSKIFGNRAFCRYNITENIFGRAELEFLRAPYWDTDANSKKTGTTVGTFLGGGFFSRGFTLTALYNFSHDYEKSPYAEPFVVRVGYYF
ncbi:MAG: hypothetical protein MI784_06135 [Cytophagales bacterium]|nr:hypothetical protein [Cytophagales bacterium]